MVSMRARLLVAIYAILVVSTRAGVSASKRLLINTKVLNQQVL